MATPRAKAFVWVTWLSGALAGEAQCAFAPWFKAHHQYSKRLDPSFDLAKWNADHGALMDRRRRELEADGWRVTVENANAFRLHGKAATLAGKPDLLAYRGDEILISDGKTGQARNKDWWQVLIYLAAVPRAFGFDARQRVSGELCYLPMQPIAVAAEDLTPARATQIWDLIRRVGDSQRPAATPSAAECRFCDISASDCPQRVEEDISTALVSEF